MSKFAVKVEKITISRHPNADALELANIADYQAIVRKRQFHDGDLVAYIPEQAIVPEALLKEMGLEGKLAGKDGNRVKAIRLRGVLSQGLVYPARRGWKLGDDVTEELGITKWEPTIPAHLAGDVFNAGLDRTLKYDIENIKKYPRVIEPGEQVVFTEKLHGTWCMFGLVPKNMMHPNPEYGRLVISSKGLSGRGLALKPNSERNIENLYVRTAKFLNIDNRISFAFGHQIKDDLNPVPVFVLGEIFGNGIQDLGYGANIDKDANIGFRVFDVYVGKPGSGRYLNDDELDQACKRLALPRVPVLYRGPFWHSKVAEFTDGLETLSGKGMHIREGIVIRPVIERTDPELGRVQLKSVSGDYLTRKGNVTEFN